MLTTLMIYLLSIDCLRLVDSARLLTLQSSEVHSYVIMEESSVTVCPLNEEHGFVAYTFSRESEGNDPRCRLVRTNVRNEDRRMKPPTNLAHERHCLWEKSAS